MPFCITMFGALHTQQAAHRRLVVEAEVAMKQAEMRTKLMQLSSGAATAATRHSKCPGCGSHEFRKHHLRTVCSYCRVEV